MAETDSKATRVRFCPEPDCQHPNPPGSARCEKCKKNIEFEPDILIGGEKQPAGKEEMTQADASPPNEGHPTGTDCPDCEAKGSVVNGHCTICEPLSVAGFALKWDDTRLATTHVPGDAPLFIGRVPPVEPSLAQYIEANFQTVSRMHAEIYISDSGVLFVRDMGSQNGTRINNRQTVRFKPECLKAGDVISFSTTLVATIIRA